MSNDYSHTWPSENEGLHYESLAFRREYPAPPQRAQLVAAIAAGDGSVMNTVLLKLDGVFELRQTPPYDNADPDPSIVVWHGAQTGDYVGLDASEDDKFIDRLFLTSMHCWLEHLQRRETQLHPNDDCSSMTSAGVEAALEEMRTNWVPAY